MIYLFDRAKKLQKIVPKKHIIDAKQNKVRNGIYSLTVEVPIFYETKKETGIKPASLTRQMWRAFSFSISNIRWRFFSFASFFFVLFMALL